MSDQTRGVTTQKDALVVRDLVKRYGSLVAVNGVSFSVRAGEIFGLLGPNGAGKTTTLEILEGLRRPDAGEALVAGIDVVKRPRDVHGKIGVQLQEAGFFESLTVAETMSTFAAFHVKSKPWMPILEQLNLLEKAKTRVRYLSGGQRQRLSIALALINDPEIVFLDEPTTGLDPQARRNLWDVIRAIRDEGRTVVLTTHYMEEAQQLCDRIAIVDHGNVIALDTPTNLIRTHAPETKVHLSPTDPTGDLTWLGELPAVIRVERVGDAVVLYTDLPETLLPALFERIRSEGLQFGGIRIETSTLEDVFLKLTGRRLRE